MEIIVESKVHGKKVILFDDNDYHLVKDIKWFASKGTRTFYAKGNDKSRGKMVQMHSIIMGVTGVDHKDHNGLNNQRSNLRIATHLQNTQNKQLSIDSSTGFKGVTYKKRKKLYLCRIRVEGVLISGGQHKNIYKAAMKYNELALKYFGEFAHLNELTKEQIEEANTQPKLEIFKNNISGYRGVSIDKDGRKNKYIATIYVDGRNQNVGRFDTPEKAAIAYNEAVIKYNKDRRFLNKIPNE